MAGEDLETFDAVKARLDAIVEAVSDDDLPLDDALALYEEAVTLGLRASDLLEADIDLSQERGSLEASAAPAPLDPAAGRAAPTAVYAATETAGSAPAVPGGLHG